MALVERSPAENQNVEVAHADEKLTAFVQLESICGFYRGFRRRRWSEFLRFGHGNYRFETAQLL